MFALPWIAFFVVSGWWFWILFLIMSGIIISCLDDTASMLSEKESDFDGAVAGWAFGVVFVGCVLWLFFGDAATHFKWVFENPGKFFSYWVVGYVVVGIVWGAFWWTFIYVPHRLEVYEDILRKWLKKNGIDGIKLPNSHKIKWAEYLLSNYSQYIQKTEVRNEDAKENIIKVVIHQAPDAWSHKSQLTTKMAYWPWTMFWSLLSDVVRSFYNKVLRVLRSTFDAISRWVFRGTKDHFNTEEGSIADILSAKLTREKKEEEAAREEKRNSNLTGRGI